VDAGLTCAPLSTVSRAGLYALFRTLSVTRTIPEFKFGPTLNSVESSRGQSVRNIRLNHDFVQVKYPEIAAGLPGRVRTRTPGSVSFFSRSRLLCVTCNVDTPLDF